MNSHRLGFWFVFGLLAVLLGVATGVSLEVIQKLVEDALRIRSPFPIGGRATAHVLLSNPETWLKSPLLWKTIYGSIGLGLASFLASIWRDPIPDLALIAGKSIRQRTVSSSMTALSVALGVALMVTVLVINGVVTRMFTQSATSYHLVLGAKGSPMQLVLNTMFFMDQPIENRPYSDYVWLKKQNWVEEAIPFALGDTTPDARFRIIGTVPHYWDLPYVPGKSFKLQAGEFFKDPKTPTQRDAIIGSRVAQTYGWKIGHEFPLAHGGNTKDLHTDSPFKVVGILAPTGTPTDRAVFIHLDGFFSISGHLKPKDEALEREAKFQENQVGAAQAMEAAKNDPYLDKEITAILVRAKSPLLAYHMTVEINEGPRMQAANPIEQISKLLSNVVVKVRIGLVVMTSLIIAVSGMGIFVSIYNTMADRRREIAVMRALGANRMTVLSIIVVESVLICLAGGIGGMLLGHLLIVLATPIVEYSADMLINPWSFESTELCLFPALMLLAVVVGIVPGFTAYFSDVARGLTE